MQAAQSEPLAPVKVRAVSPGASVNDFFQLMKPRVMSLVILTALTGMVLAPGHIHPLMGFIAILAVSVGAGASGALNMWFDADIDSQMQRTTARPIPRGKVSADDALAFGTFLSFASVLVLGLLVNWVAGLLLAITIGFYIFVYTMWLKRRTAQNIVIGGAAGAFPPMIGWAAVTGSVSIESVLLFAIIFFWTPPHFWALALFVETDYAKAGIPMMPVVAGHKSTRRQILVYAVLMLPISMAPFWLGVAGWLYGASALLLSAVFLLLSLRVAVFRGGAGDNDMRPEKRLFGFSVLYLFALFAMLVADRYLVG